ncbi:MAG TPA: prepilin-type N-terminal cleavage/methylation domain-containing protein, partial [Acidimicrobiales bacterium]|nr:prepilin-type N-terminal cleavage/methylation domain-containing protein [Acidimicrobiales bacterium]
MARVGRRPGRDEGGFGLVEVMLSLSVLLVVLVATSFLVDNVAQQAATSRQKVAATELAEQWLEQLSNDPIASLQAYIAKDVQLTPQPVTVASVAYTVWGHLEWGDTGATHSLCTTGNPP